MATIDCVDKTTREINLAIKQLLAQGVAEITVQNPAARHNLGVALLQATKITFTGSVGYYCAGMSDGPTVEIQGSAGWGLAESMLSGTIHVGGNAGNGAAALRGGTVGTTLSLIARIWSLMRSTRLSRRSGRAHR